MLGLELRFRRGGVWWYENWLDIGCGGKSSIAMTNIDNECVWILRLLS